MRSALFLGCSLSLAAATVFDGGEFATVGDMGDVKVISHLSLLQSKAQLHKAEERSVQHRQLALADIVMQTVEALRWLNVNSSDITDRLDEMVRDAKSIQEGYAAVTATGALSGSLDAKFERSLPPIGFVKTHRTGGSSITSILQRIGDARGLSFVLPANGVDLGWLHAFPGPALLASNAVDKRQHDIVCNFAVFDDARMRHYLKPSPFFFTMLRSPASQLHSTFEERLNSASNFFGYHMQVSWSSRLKWLKAAHQKPEVAKLLSATDRAQFLNPQAHDLGWYSHVNGSTEFDSDDAMIDEWIGGLASQFGLVLVTEHYDEGLLLLRKKLGIGLHDMAYLYNATKQSAAGIRPTQAEADEIEDINRVDARLFQHFNASFWKEWESAGGYDAFESELQELRLWNEVLARACAEKNRRMCPWSLEAGNVAFTDYLKKKTLTV